MDNKENHIERKIVQGLSKVNIVRQYSHMAHLITGLGKNREHFAAIAKMAKTIPVVEITRSQLTPIPEFVTYIYNEISK